MKKFVCMAMAAMLAMGTVPVYAARLILSRTVISYCLVERFCTN